MESKISFADLIIMKVIQTLPFTCSTVGLQGEREAWFAGRRPLLSVPWHLPVAPFHGTVSPPHILRTSTKFSSLLPAWGRRILISSSTTFQLPLTCFPPMIEITFIKRLRTMCWLAPSQPAKWVIFKNQLYLDRELHNKKAPILSQPLEEIDNCMRRWNPPAQSRYRRFPLAPA